MNPQVNLYDDVLKNRWLEMVYDKESKLVNNRMSLIFKWVWKKLNLIVFSRLKFAQWTPEERFAFLKKLIILSSSDERLEFYNFCKTVVPETSIDFTRILPRTVSLYILSFLDPRSLCRACQSELRKIRRKIALDRQRAEEEKRNQLAFQDIRQRKPSARKASILQISKVSEKPIKAKTAPKCIKTSKSPDRHVKQGKIDRNSGEKEKWGPRNTGGKRAGELLTLSQCLLPSQAEYDYAKHLLARTLHEYHPRNKLSTKFGKRLDNAENTHQRMSSSRWVERNSEKQMSMKERIAGVTERLSAPLERRRRNSISHSPMQNITHNETIGKQRQSSLPRRKVHLPTSMIVAPPGQRFAPLSPESIKTLPPPPVYKRKTEVDKSRKRNWTKKQQQIFDYVKDIPS
ncbi:hypothetical protein ACTXT7_011649 [Hymenolepis weldensis]